MFNWLQNLYNWISGQVSSVYQFIVSAIRAVYSYFDQYISNIWNAFLSFYSSVEQWIGAIYGYIWQVILNVYGLIQDVYNYIGQWILRIYQDIYNWLGQLGRWMTQQIQQLKDLLAQYASQLLNWVINNVYLPLYNLISSGIRDLWAALENVLNLINSPDQLVAFIARYLWSAWLDLLRRYSQPIARWLVKSMLLVADDFISVLETIITSII